jgi:hypothetical protein
MNHNYKIPKSKKVEETISILLPFYGLKLISIKTDLPSVKIINVWDIKEETHLGGLQLDERNSTITNGYYDPNPNELLEELTNKYKELKKSNINYGNIGLYPETSDGYEYPGKDNLTIEKFFDYLKSDNREQIINNTI